MIVGASSGVLYPDLQTEEAVDTLARLGFPTLELVLQTAGEYKPHFARVLARRVRAAAVEVHSIHTLTQLHPVFDRYPRRRAEAVDMLRRGIDLAAAVGARCLIWHGLTRRDHQSGVTWEQFRDVLEPLAREAQQAGVVVTLENVSWCAVRDANAVRQVQAWHLPLGFTFDPFQAEETGADAADLVDAMGGTLRNVHLSDHQPDGRRHLPPGEGTINWSRILALVQDIGYRGPLILEGNCAGNLDRLTQSRDVVLAALADAGAA